MRAAVLLRFGGPDAVRLDDVALPQPGPGEVRVRVGAAATNNTDLWTREGRYGRPGDPQAKAGWRGRIDFPRIQGADVAGVVDAVGDQVSEQRVGRRVLLDPAWFAGDGPDPELVGVLGSEHDGGFAEHVVVPSTHAYDVTGSPLSDAELACLPISYGTAVGMLERGHVRHGERVLVTGASGGVGLALVQLAAARGCRVLAQTRPEKADLVRASGAEEILGRDGVPPEASLDAVLDVVGGPRLAELLPALRPGGRWIVAGAVSDPVISLDLRRLYLHNRVLVGSTMHAPAHFAVLVEAARAGTLAPRVAATYPLERIHEAHAALAQRDHVGKIVMLPGRDAR